MFRIWFLFEWKRPAAEESEGVARVEGALTGDDEMAAENEGPAAVDQRHRSAQLVWRGKDKQDWSDPIVNVLPLCIHERVYLKAIIDDLKRRAAQKREAQTDAPDLFSTSTASSRISAPNSTSTTYIGRTG